MDINPEIKAYSVVVYSPDELGLYSKSIYTMVEMSKALKKVVKLKSNFAVVGLPCHIQAITQMLNAKRMSEKCKLKIGLMDGKNVCLHALHYDIAGKNYSEYKFRGRGWWQFEVSRKCRDIMEYIPWSKTNFSLIWDNFIMMPERCVICSDFTAEYSDISVCDAWLKKYEYDTDGHSIIITRNQKADNILKEMKDDKRIHLLNSNINSIYSSQFIQIDFKKRLFGLKVKIYQLLFKKFKHIRIGKLSHVNISDFVAIFKLIILNATSLHLIRYNLYHCIPLSFLRINRKFVFQPLVVKILYKITKIKGLKYANFKERM